MPELDGLEASRRIRKHHQQRAPRIIGLTSTALPDDREQCLAAGMEEVITKPFQFSSLSRARSRQLRKLPGDPRGFLFAADSSYLCAFMLCCPTGPPTNLGRFRE